MVIANQRATADHVGEQLEQIEALGYDSAWMPGIPNGPDVLTLFAATAHRTSRIEVRPGDRVRARSPSGRARQPGAHARTTRSAARLTLGIGVSHRRVVEDFFGLDYRHPARYMTEYLQILGPLLHDQRVDFRGEMLRTTLPARGLDRGTPGSPRLPRRARSADARGRGHPCGWCGHVDGRAAHPRRAHRATRTDSGRARRVDRSPASSPASRCC